MSKSLAHRGPDAQNNWNDDVCYMGFRHLSLVGDVRSIQPLHNERNTVHLVCNGEIYNYKELYAELITKGHIFSSGSDCEVIIHAYEEYGDRVCSLLHGQFAFVLWDSTNHRLLAARDRFGICPLFYTKTSDRIIFASEIKALCVDTSIKIALNVNGIAQTALMYGPTPPETCFKQIFQIPPGSYVHVESPRLKLTTHTYWNITFNHQGNIKKSTVQSSFDSLFTDAVKRRIHGNFLPAVYASGGLDSSAVAAILKNILGDVELFSLQFDDKHVDETSFQNLLAKHLSATLHRVRVRTSDISDNLLRCIWHCESPLTRLAPVPMMLLSERVREAGYQYVLSGEGADELLAGYPVFVKNRSSIQEKFQSSRQLLRLFRNPSVNRTATKKFKSFVERNMKNNTSKLEKSQNMEIQTKLSRYLLTSQGDRVALSHAVEQRFPFLDESLVDFMVRLPSSLKLHNHTGKTILRRTCAHLLPHTIVQRAKQGYLAPDSATVQSPKIIKSWNEEFLSDRVIISAGYFNLRRIQRLKKLIMSEAGQYDKQVIRSWLFVVTTQMLHRLFVEKDTGSLNAPSPSTSHVPLVLTGYRRGPKDSQIIRNNLEAG
jgi:asparagine synthase (glutamine-hydrolysing)